MREEMREKSKNWKNEQSREMSQRFNTMLSIYFEF
jgi:hypothetical protein